MRHLTTGDLEDKATPHRQGHLGIIVVFVLVVGLFLAISLGMGKNHLPKEARHALNNATSGTLYSLEPWRALLPAGSTLPELADYPILGQTKLDAAQTARAAGAVRYAVTSWSLGTASGFDPRHALRVTSEGHTYDFLLCYACGKLEIRRDGEHLGWAPITGTPDILNKILRAASVPLSPYYAKRENVRPAPAR
jgi:hypothetical protein